VCSSDLDYCHVIGDGEEMPFVDSVTGRRIVGLPWQQTLRETAQRVAELMR
jgi:hypothetical protein